VRRKYFDAPDLSRSRTQASGDRRRRRDNTEEQIEKTAARDPRQSSARPVALHVWSHTAINRPVDRGDDYLALIVAAFLALAVVVLLAVTRFTG